MDIQRQITALLETQQKLLALAEQPPSNRESFSPAEVAVQLNRKPYTVREWCRLGRIHARKRPTGRGDADEWEIPAAEVERIKNHGLLAIPTKY